MKQPTRGPLLRETRTKLGLSQVDLARLLGVSQPVVCKWERGESNPGRIVLMTVVLASRYPVVARAALNYTTPRAPFEVMMRHYQARRVELRTYFGRDLAVKHEPATRLATMLDLVAFVDPEEVERGRAWWNRLRSLKLIGLVDDDD